SFLAFIALTPRAYHRMGAAQSLPSCQTFLRVYMGPRLSETVIFISEDGTTQRNSERRESVYVRPSRGKLSPRVCERGARYGQALDPYHRRLPHRSPYLRGPAAAFRRSSR